MEEAFDPNTKYILLVLVKSDILLVLVKSGEGPGNEADGE